MFICDTHSDTLFSLGVMKRPLAECCITPQRLLQGGVTLQTFALWSGPKGPHGDYEAVAEAEFAAVQQLTAAGLRQVDAPTEAKEGECAFMLSLEGCEVFHKGLSAVAEWRQRGVRMGALVWNHANRIGTPAKINADDRLTDYGLSVVHEMQRLGVAVDVSHLNEGGFFDLFRRGHVPPMASHSCCRALCDHFRNLTDEQIRMMIQYGGYIGVNFYPVFLSEDGKADSVTIAQHIDHICQLGGAGIVGFGSDFDGIECFPEDVQHPGQMGNLLEALRSYGYSEEAIRGIAGQNLLDYFARIC
ncbi:MAG: membrane dipeptidase [Clostridia bacterium]|nr:membrane dipeptidase [Clostridia bacterium]